MNNQTKPKFDPNKPFDVVDENIKPKFDPNKPFEEVSTTIKPEQNAIDYGPFTKEEVEKFPQARQNFERWQKEQQGITEQPEATAPTISLDSNSYRNFSPEQAAEFAKENKNRKLPEGPKLTPAEIASAKAFLPQLDKMINSVDIPKAKTPDYRERNFGMYAGSMYANEKPEERKARETATTTKNVLEKTKDYYEAVANGDAGAASKFWSGLKTFDLQNTLALGIKDMAGKFDIYDAAKNFSEGKATPQETNLLIAQAMLEEIQSTAQKDRSISVGSGLSEMAPWLAQFAATGGMGTSAVNATTKALGNSLAAKITARLVGSAVQTATQVPMMAQGTAERMTDRYALDDTGRLKIQEKGEGFGEALLRTYANNYLENLSERGVGDAADLLARKGVNAFLKSNTFGKTYAADLINWARKNPYIKVTNRTFGLNTPLSENIEEAFTGLTQPFVTEDNWKDIKKGVGEYFTGENLYRTFLTTAAMGAGMGLAQAPGQIYHTARSEQGRKLVEEAFDEQANGLFYSAATAETVEEREKYWEELVRLTGMNAKELNPVMHYYQTVLTQLENGIDPRGQRTIQQEQQPFTVGAQSTPPVKIPTIAEEVQAERENVANRAAQMVQERLHTSGKYITVFDNQGNEYQVADGDMNTPAGQLIVYKPIIDQSGAVTGYEKKPHPVSDLLKDEKTGTVVFETSEPQQIVDEVINTFDLKTEQAMLTPAVGEKLMFDGKEYLVQADNGETITLFNKQSLSQVEVPKQDIINEQKQAGVNTENILQQQAEIIKTSENEPVNEGITPEVDNNLSENAPIERKITTQKFDGKDIDIIENENYDEVVASDKMPLEKALPVLEKKFKDNKRFKLEVDKVQVEIPGETKYDDPVKKTVIKGIRIVPIQNQNENADTKTNEAVGNPLQNEIQTPAAGINAITTPDTQSVGANAVQPELTPAQKLQAEIKQLEKDYNASRPEYKARYKQQLEAKQAELEALTNPKPEILETPELTPEQKTGQINRLLDEAKYYDEIPKNHTNKRRTAANSLRNLAAKIGYSTGVQDGKTIVFDENKHPVTNKIAVKTSQEDIQAHKALADYTPEQQAVISWFTDDINRFNMVSMYYSGNGNQSNMKNIQSAINNIKAGKKTVAANNLLDDIESMINSGGISFTDGFSAPLDEFMAMWETEADIYWDTIVDKNISQEELNELFLEHENENTSNQATSDAEGNGSIGENGQEPVAGNEGNQPEVEETVNISEEKNKKLTETKIQQPVNQQEEEKPVSESEQKLSTSEKDFFVTTNRKGKFFKTDEEFELNSDELSRFDEITNTLYPKEVNLENIQPYNKAIKKWQKSVIERLSQKQTEKVAIDNEIAAQNPNTNPTEGQKEAGNYKKAHITVNGLDITIENPKGSIRSGKDEDGKIWEHEMKSHYGYFKRTEGKDGDQIDVFVGEQPESGKIFVIDQNDPKTGNFDESKVMMGYNSAEESKAAYLENYDKDWKGFSQITEVDLPTFTTWLNDGKRQRKPFGDYKNTPAPVNPNQPAIDKLKSDITGLQKQISAKQKEIDNRNGLFGDIATPTGLFGQQGFDIANAKKVIDGYKAEISRKEKEIETLTKAGETGAKEAAAQQELIIPETPKKQISKSEIDDIISASSRFRPKEKIVFERPIVGPSGAKLTSYEWKYRYDLKDAGDEGIVESRVSDWTSAEQSADTGRDVVHQFTVEMPDGTTKLVSSESVLILLGITDREQMKSFPSLVNAVKTLAKQQMQLAILEAQQKQYDDAYEYFLKQPKPEITIIAPEGSVSKRWQDLQDKNEVGSHTRFFMGESFADQPNKLTGRTFSAITEPSEETIKDVTNEWIKDQIKATGIKPAQGIYDLKQRIERQQRKVNEITLSATPKVSPLEKKLALAEQMKKERKDRILSEGTNFDKPFDLIPVNEIKTADDILANVEKIISTLKANEGNKKYDTFEGFAYGGKYAKNAGEQIRGYFMAIDVLPIEIRKEFAGRINISTSDELVNWGEKQYNAIKQEERVPEAGKTKEPWEMTKEELLNRYKPGNPFREKAANARHNYNQLIKPSVRDKAMEEAFPLGAGFGTGNARYKRLDQSIDKAIKAQEYRQEAEWQEARAFAYDEGKINAQGRKPAKNADLAAEKREERKQIVEDAKAEREGKENWQITSDVYAHSANIFGGSPMELAKYNHKEAVIQAKERGENIPASVKAEYPELFEEKPVSEDKKEVVQSPVKGEEQTPVENQEYIVPEKFSIQSFDEFVKLLNDGKINISQFKQAFEAAQNSREEIIAELSKKTKDELFKTMSAYGAAMYRNEKKDRIVRSLFNDYLMNFSFGMISYGMNETLQEAIAKKVAKTTQEDIDNHVADVQKQREEYAEKVRQYKKALANPETLDEFKIFIKKNGLSKLSLEQKARYDELVTDKVLDERSEEADKKAVVEKVDTGEVEFTVVETKHTKTGQQLFVVKQSARVSDETYKELSAKAKKLGGYYSSYSKDGAIPGYIFKTREAAEQFANINKENAVSTTTEEKEVETTVKTVSKLRENAQKMIEKADEELNRPRLTNTAKRAREAASTEVKWEEEKRIAQTMINIADAIENGDVKLLDGIKAKTHIQLLDSLIRTAKYYEISAKSNGSYTERQKLEGEPATLETIEYLKNGFLPNFYASQLKDLFNKAENIKGVKNLAAKWQKKVTGAGEYDYYQTRNADEVEEISQMFNALPERDRKYNRIGDILADYKRLVAMGIENDSMLRSALREYIQYRGKKQAPDKVKELERAIVGRGRNIGFDFFPTPSEVAKRMVDIADVNENMEVLEPSAGNGNIADQIKEAGVMPDVIEISSELTEILKAKGYDVVASDFLEFNDKKYDRIIMNPPFSNGLDGDHVKHAYDLLKPGGKIVAIIGEGTFTRSDKKATAFREWLDEVGGTETKLEAGTFQDKTLLNTTGANARLVVIEKEAEFTEEPFSKEEQDAIDEIVENFVQSTKNEQPEPEAEPKSNEPINDLKDFGEKIGAARKDLGITRKVRETDSMPSWRRKYEYSNADGTFLLGGKVDTSKPFLVQWGEEVKSFGRTSTRMRPVTEIKDGYLTRTPMIFTSEQEAENYIPIYEAKRQGFKIYKNKADNFAIYKRASNNKLLEFDSFPTQEEAETYLHSTEGATSLLNRKRETFNIPQLEKIQRTGKDYRNGKNIDEKEFMQTFGFRGGEFGNWVKTEERQTMLNLAYDSFMDLANILNISPRAISLGGELSIAFGARGTGGFEAFNAHYESSRAVINLTKLKGAGAIAHEWMHALDNYFGLQDAKKDYSRDEKGELKTKEAFLSETETYKAGMRKELKDIFRNILDRISKKEVTRVIAEDSKQKVYDGFEASIKREADYLRTKLEKGVRQYKYNRKTKQREEVLVKATPEQLKQANNLIDKIVSGNSTKPEWMSIGGKGFGGEYSYISEDLKAVDEIYKEVFGHTGLKRNGGGFYNMAYYANKLYFAKEQLGKAQNKELETVKVKTELLENSEKFDASRVSPYFSKPVEMLARSFEQFIVTKLNEQGIRSDYLQYDKSPVYKAFYEISPYPDGQDLTDLNSLFEKFWNTVQERQEGENTILFSQMSFNRSNIFARNIKSRDARKEIVEALNDIQSRATGANDLVIANNFNDMLNKFAQNGASDSKVEFVRQKGGRANGFYDIQGRTVYINLEKINSKDEAIAVWVHENGWHNGVRNIVPEAELDKLFEKIYDSFTELGKKDPKVAEIVYHVLTNYAGTTKATKGNEMAAKMAEKITSEEDLNPVEKGFWQQIMDWVRQMLKKWIKFDSGLLTEKQLAQLIKSAVQSNFQGPEDGERRKGKPEFMTGLYHGSPHKFDRFSTDYMGTGEGAQAYGWGLYFTDKEGIARSYAELRKTDLRNLTFNDKPFIDVVPLDGNEYWDRYWANWLPATRNKDHFIEMVNQQYLDGRIASPRSKRARDFEKQKQRLIDAANNGEIKGWPEKSRNLYKVKIHGDKTIEELNFLRWDKELTKQQITDLITKIRKADDNSQESIDYELEQYFRFNDRTGEGLYKYLSNQLGSDKETSLILLKNGIDGIQYPSEYTTKGQHEDSFNFVVFDENAIEIEDNIQFAFLGETGAANLDKAEEATTRLDNLKVAKEMEAEGKTDIKNIDSEINELMKSLEEKYPVDLWFAYKKYSNAIVLSNIQVDKKERNKGIGTAIMNEIIALADKYGVAIGLTPTNDFGGNVARLRQFYRSFDFVPYKGYEMRESFIRKAKPVKSFTSQQIKLATGWERGSVDKKWRYEIPDNFEILNLPEVKEGEVKTGLTLKDIIKHDELFKAYPEIKDVYVIVTNDPKSNTFASVSNDGLLLTINNNEKLYKGLDNRQDGTGNRSDSDTERGVDNANDLGRAIVHEIQHLIQVNEGFQLGGSSKDAQRLFPKDVFGADLYNDLLEGRIRAKDFTPEDNKAIAERAFAIYQRFAGEVEARNAAKRLNFTPEQRRQTLAEETEDVRREDQIFIYDGLGASLESESIPETITIDGKERPTRNSNGQFIHPTLEGIKNFWKWFSDSKVTDEQGRPLVVYHGTGTEFNEFMTTRRGIWLTPDETRASGYARGRKGGEEGIVMPLYAKIENPSSSEYNDDYSMFYTAGFDGWMSKKSNGEFFTIVVKSPTQIKSATNNQGTFNPEEANINFSIPEPLKRPSPKDFVTVNEYLKALEIYKENKEAERKSVEELEAKLEERNRLLEKAKELEEKKERTKKIKETHFNHTLIKDKLIAIKQGYKLGQADLKEQIKLVQSLIVEYARENMPLENATKAEIMKVIESVRNTTSPEKLSAVFDKIDDLATGVEKRKSIKGIDLLLKNNRPKKVNGRLQGSLPADLYIVLDKIRQIRKLKNSDEQDAYLASIADNDTETVALAATFMNLKERSREDADMALLRLSQLVSTGKLWFADEIEQRKKFQSDLRKRAIAIMTDNRGVLSEQDLNSLGLIVEKGKLDLFINQHRSFEWLMDAISKNKKEETGEGWLQEYFGDLVNNSTNKETSGIRNQIEAIHNKASEIFKADKSKLAKILKQNSEKVKKTGVTYLRKDGERFEIELSQNQAYKKWMEMQDPTLKGTFDKMGWDETTKQQLENFMTPEVKQWAEWQLNEFYPEYYKGVNAKFKNAYFVNMPFNPKYSPIKREVTEAGALEDDMLKNKGIIHGPGNASLKSRVTNVNALRLVDGDVMLATHISDMEHFKAWVDTAKILRAVFSSRSAQHVLKYEHGNTVRRVLNEQIDDLISGGADRAFQIDFIDRIRSAFSTAELGLNLTLFPKQLTGMLAYMSEVPTKDYLMGMMNLAFNFREALNLLKESEFVKNRYQAGWTHEIHSALKQNTSGALSGTKSWLGDLRNFLMFPTRFGDYGGVLAGWTVYRYHYRKQKELGKTDEQAHQFALNKFERSASRTQQSATLKDTSELQKGSWGKLFTMFKNSQQQYFRYEAAAVQNLMKGRGSRSRNLRLIGIYHVVLPVVFQLVTNIFTDDDDETEALRALRAGLLGSLNGLFIISDILETLLERATGDNYEYTLTPVETTANKLFDAVTNFYKGVVNGDREAAKRGTEQLIYGLNNAFIGLPYRPTKKLIEQGKEYANPSEYKITKAHDQFKIQVKDARRIINKMEMLKDSDTESYEQFVDDNILEIENANQILKLSRKANEKRSLKEKALKEKDNEGVKFLNEQLMDIYNQAKTINE